MARSKASKRRRRHAAVILRDRKQAFGGHYWLCYLCRNELKREHITIDHIQPRSRGGTNDKSNLAVCCGECNKKKKNKTLAQYLKENYPESMIVEAPNDRFHNFGK